MSAGWVDNCVPTEIEAFLNPSYLFSTSAVATKALPSEATGPFPKRGADIREVSRLAPQPEVNI